MLAMQDIKSRIKKTCLPYPCCPTSGYLCVVLIHVIRVGILPVLVDIQVNIQVNIQPYHLLKTLPQVQQCFYILG